LFDIRLIMPWSTLKRKEVGEWWLVAVFGEDSQEAVVNPPKVRPAVVYIRFLRYKFNPEVESYSEKQGLVISPK
jgi:hypothetical protein